MKPDLLTLLMESQPLTALSAYLDQTSFDEMAEIDLPANRYRNVTHAEHKYWVPVLNGSYSAVYQHFHGELVHPEDRAAHEALMRPEGMAERLAQAEKPGIMEAVIRLRLRGGIYRRARYLLIGGEAAGMPEGRARVYIYDTEAEAYQPQGALALPQVDDLTGLLMENDFLLQAEDMRRTAQGDWCMIAIDIEQYNLLKDWHGREQTLYVLARFGAVLARTAEETGGLAGYRGQDYFCLMMPYKRPRIDKLYRELRDTMQAFSHSIGFSPVMGVCALGKGDETALEAFNHAAFSAEEIRGNLHTRIRVYDGQLRRKSMQEYHLLTDFQQALENGEITFWLQPQCRVSSRKIVGAESLARWRRTDGSYTPPAVFVPILERHGIVTTLDQFIWESVCKWLRGLIDRGIEPVPVSVNVSPIDLFNIDVPEYLRALLGKYGLPASLIKIEITESAYVEDTALVRAAVKKLREMGFLVLMDDFGSGYSSLNMLSSLNVDVIKLDAQFLHLSKQGERKGVSILESVINMAKTLSTPVIVEGVENQEQAAFLSDLGCRYMQGYFFHRPMPPKEFERLIRDESNTDRHGFEFKANQEMHVREFLDENVYSDAMLNNILGPVAFYAWKDNQVDIVRYNQQFYLMVGIELEELNRRIHGMEAYLYPEDRERFFRTMERAVSDRLNGAGGVFRVYKPSGVIVWIQVHMYYMGEDARGKRFYSSNQDVTELQYLNADIPGGYYRCDNSEEFAFQYVSDYFLQMTGFTREEIRDTFDNKLINMVHPQDRARMIRDSALLAKSGHGSIRPYRLLKKSGDYLYAADQSRLTDQFGSPCWQSVTVDVTEMMMLRNQMRLLTRFSSDSILYTRHTPDGPVVELAVHGLEERSGLSKDAFEKALNNGDFYRWVEDGRQLSHQVLDRYFETHTNAFEREFMVHPPNGHHIRLHMKTDRVTDETMGVEYITVLREV